MAAVRCLAQYHVRSIGSVPVLFMPERLRRLLPVQEMDATLELDVSLRQVRGASLQLVRAGLAIWKRDRLLPIERQLECGLAL